MPPKIKLQVVHAIRTIGRPLYFTELVPLVLGKTPHGVDPATGKVLYPETPEFQTLIDEMVSSGELVKFEAELGPQFDLPA